MLKSTGSFAQLEGVAALGFLFAGVSGRARRCGRLVIFFNQSGKK